MVSVTSTVVVKEIDLRFYKGVSVPPEDGVTEAGGNDPKVNGLNERSGMGSVNRDLDVTTEWKLFSAPELYDNVDDEETDVTHPLCSH